jgi:peptidyl-prolyl cis-trans isomerase D
MTMLDRMRRHKAWLKWSLGLVVLTFVVFYIPDFLQPGATTGATGREVVADVNGDELYAAEFRNRYAQQMQTYRAQLGGNVNDALLRQLRIEERVLTDMIDEQVAIQEAERRGIRVSDEEVAQAILAIPVFSEGGQFIGEARYRQLLASNTPPLTVDQFEEGMRRNLRIIKLRNALTDWMALSEREVETEYRKRNEKVKLQVVALTADQFRDTVTATEAEVAAHFDAHKAEYRVGEQRQVKYFLIDAQQARLKVNVTPQEVERYYTRNMERYRTPEQVRASHILFRTAGKDEAAVRKTAEEVLQQVKAGGDFAALARKYSEDEASKETGGDLDFSVRERFVPEFATAAFNLKPGETSDLVKSEFGLHIIRVTDKRAEVTRPLDDVRQEIQEQLLTEKANAQVMQLATSLSDMTSVADMEKAAPRAGTTVQESDFFTREGPIGALGVSPEIADRAFALEEGAVTGPISTPRGPVFIALTGKKDPYIPMLDEVRDRVRNDLIRQKAAELSRQRAGEIAATLASAKDFAAAAKAQGLEAKTTELITRNSPLPDVGVSPEVDKVAFDLKAGATSAPIATGDGTVIVRVVEREDVKPEDFRTAREAFRAQLLVERRDKFFAAYMTKIREKTTVDVKTDVMQRLVTANQAI